MIDWNMNRQIIYNQDLEYATSMQIDANKFQQLEQEKQKWEQWCRQTEQRIYEWANRVEHYKTELLPEPVTAFVLVKFTSVSLTGVHHTRRRRFALDASARQLICFVFSSGMIDDPNVTTYVNMDKSGFEVADIEVADIIDNVNIVIRDAVGSIRYTLADEQCPITIRELIGDKNIALVVVQEPVTYTTQQTVIDLTNDD